MTSSRGQVSGVNLATEILYVLSIVPGESHEEILAGKAAEASDSLIRSCAWSVPNLLLDGVGPPKVAKFGFSNGLSETLIREPSVKSSRVARNSACRAPVRLFGHGGTTPFKTSSDTKSSRSMGADGRDGGN